MVFFNREKDIKRFKAVLSGEPNLIHFVYGPINSGKTALLIKVFDELPSEYRVFYINFRARYISEFQDLLKVLFEVQFSRRRKKAREIVKEFFKAGTKAVERYKGIPIPEKIFDHIFADSRRVDDVFRYLEDIFEETVKAGLRPVLVLDELQLIKEVVNTSGRPVLKGLFNFMVRVTKELHLCHCLCATSDCLFIEEIYFDARLEGRAEYLLVDDLEKEDALRVYKNFGFKEKDLIWDYVGGKIGDMVRLLEKKKQGYNEQEALEHLLTEEKARLTWLLGGLKEENSLLFDEVEEILAYFEANFVMAYDPLKRKALRFLIAENVLFYDPLKGEVRPQGKLLWHAIKNFLGNGGSHVSGNQKDRGGA